MIGVVWKPRRGITHPALAVPCSACGAFIGRPCRRHYAAGEFLAEPHKQRCEIADEHGFRWAIDPAPPAEPEPETDQRQTTMPFDQENAP